MRPLHLAAFAAALAAFSSFPTTGSASLISFVAQAQTNSSRFSITNLSEEGVSITGLTIQLGDNTAFDTAALALGTLTDPGGDLTFAPALNSAIVDGAFGAALSFTGFDANDVFEFSVGFVDRLDGSTAAGPDMNNAFVLVSFSNGHSLQTTFNGGPIAPPRSGRQSFTFDGETVANPEPASLVLVLMGLCTIGLLYFRRARVDLGSRRAGTVSSA